MNREGTDQRSFSTWVGRPETLIGLSAVLLSLCGLSIAIYEASLIRRAQRASVWPHVEVTGTVNGYEVTLRVQNTGVGPARIRAAAVTYEGETVANWEDMIRSVIGDELDSLKVDSLNIYWSLINGRVLPANAPKEDVFSITSDDGLNEGDAVDSLQQAIFDGAVDVTVCYCSVYDECWVSSLQDVLSRSRGGATSIGAREVDGCTSAERSGI